MFQTKAAGWNIPSASVTDLTAALTAAKEILAVVKSGERTAASVEQCNEAFKELETEARFIKKHYLLVPPLTAEDLASLLLSQEATSNNTPIEKPTGQPSVTVMPDGLHLLKVYLNFLTGTKPLDARGDYGYALYGASCPRAGPRWNRPPAPSTT